MYFYKILASSQRYHGSEPLTYSSDDRLEAGLVVIIPLGKQKVLGVVYAQSEQPSFATKPIISVVSNTPLPKELLQLHDWLVEYYPSPLGLTTQLFLPSSLSTTARKKTEKITKSLLPISAPLPPLTEEQAKVIKTIQAGLGSFLLHGETGTGKTRVYLELTSETLRSNKSALILTPEIGLTPQLTKAFEMTFPGQVITVHSTQTPAERRKSWLAIHDTEKPLVVIGPRSALFSPINKLGLVVIDEAHDGAYKQEQMPYYQASRVAGRLAALHDAKLVLGTATPLVHDYYTFASKNLPIVRMETPAIAIKTDTTLEVVDLKEREHFSRSPWISNQLIAEVEKALNDNAQSLLFLNRRGTARLVLCQTCGWQATCPRCDLPLTYHGDSHHLRCHTCGYTSDTPSACPDCGSTEIKFKSIGTKTITSEVERLFPKARVQRFDGDSKKSERLEEHYTAIKDGSVDILIGTQMLSKGLDLPKLGVVGVILADTSLYFPDYTAEERTFQMLRQVNGRVGRGHRAGTIVIQTYYPNSPTIQAAVNKNYGQFYEAQLAERELYRFPPFYFMLKISIERAVLSSARTASQELAQSILRAGFLIELSGPSPAFVEKTHDRYRWQIIIKSKQRGELTKVIAMLPKNCSYDIDPSNLL